METTCRVTQLKITTYKNTNIGLQHKMYIMGLEHMMQKTTELHKLVFTVTQ